MKKLLTITKKSLIFIGMIAFIGLMGSCEEKKDTIWDDNVAPTLISLSSNNVKVGDEISITGKYFSSTAENTVSFNGIEATITAANISIIKVIVPDGAADGEIMVTSNGHASTNQLPYTIIQPIIPTITSIDPVKGKIGQTVIITGTNFSTTPSENVVKFNGTAATVIASTATEITTTVPANATTGNVTVTRDGESNGILFTVTVSYTITVQITESADDVEEGGLNGAMTLTSSDLEIGEWDTWDAVSGTDQGVQPIGVRFPGIDLPASATILTANIQFTSDASGDKPRQITIYGENVANAPVYTEDPYNVTTRERTTANSVWDIPEWTAEGLAGPAQKTTDLINIVQEILDRGDWVSGNSMNFILLYTGVPIAEGESSGGRQTKSLDDGADGVAPILTIVYEL